MDKNTYLEVPNPDTRIQTSPNRLSPPQDLPRQPLTLLLLAGAPARAPPLPPIAKAGIAVVHDEEAADAGGACMPPMDAIRSLRAGVCPLRQPLCFRKKKKQKKQSKRNRKRKRKRSVRAPSSSHGATGAAVVWGTSSVVSASCAPASDPRSPALSHDPANAHVCVCICCIRLRRTPDRLRFPTIMHGISTTNFSLHSGYSVAVACGAYLPPTCALSRRESR